jgi:hypothetical protein
MADTFKNATANLVNTTNTTIYTAPGAANVIVLSCIVSNIDGVNDADVDIWFYDSSAAAATQILKTVAVPADTTLEAVSKKWVLEGGDYIMAGASANSDLSSYMSVLEIT